MMRAKLLTAAATCLAFAALAAAPANAQNQRNRNDAQSGPVQNSPLAMQAMQGSSQPDVLLDVPNLSVEQLTVDVTNLQVHLALDAQLANLLHLTAGADARIDNVRIDLRGVRAQATLIVRLENVRAIIERTLQTLDNNPALVTQLLSTVDHTVSTVGGVANNTVNTVGGVATSLLRNGQVLDLARAGLTEVSRNVVNGQTVRQVTDRAGQALEVVTDTANRVVSWRRLPTAPTGPTPRTQPQQQ